MENLVIQFLVGVFLLAVALRILRTLWLIFLWRICGFKPLKLDEQRLERTVNECTRLYVNAMKNGVDWQDLDEEERQENEKQVRRYTTNVIERYFERGELGL